MMIRLITAPILCAVLGAAPTLAGPVSPLSPTQTIAPDQVVEVKNDTKGNGKAKGKAKAVKKDKPAKAKKAAKAEKAAKPDKGGQKDKALKKREKAAKANTPEKALKSLKTKASGDDNALAKLPRGFTTNAPAERDMVDLLRTAALIWATPDLVLADTGDTDLLKYRNCPPGLLKKDPPCVPPGLAKQGVSTRDWLGYDEARYDSILQDRLTPYLSDRDLDDQPRLDRPLLTSEQIAALYGLDPAPRGQKYALIDGMPTLLDNDEHAALLRVNQLARPADIAPGTVISPNAALSQEELRRLYALPRLEDGRNYAVLNGRLITLNDQEYELLQMLRVSRAVL